jgi:hypothetical protein
MSCGRGLGVWRVSMEEAMANGRGSGRGSGEEEASCDG